MASAGTKAKIVDPKLAGVHTAREENAPVRLSPRLPYRPVTPLSKIRKVVRQVIAARESAPKAR